MDKFFGMVGYGVLQESPADSGVWKPVITEYPYYGDILRNSRQLDPRDAVNDNISVGHSISIVADEQAMQHFTFIKFAVWNDVAWEVQNVEVQAPRLILTLDKVYTGPRQGED